MDTTPLVNATTQKIANEKLTPQGSNKPGYWNEQFNEWSKHFKGQPLHQNGHTTSKAAAE